MSRIDLPFGDEEIADQIHDLEVTIRNQSRSIQRKEAENARLSARVAELEAQQNDSLAGPLNEIAEQAQVMFDVLTAAGVNTLAELSARLAPDPRVAVLDGLSSNKWMNSEWPSEAFVIERFLRKHKLIAAERGEG